MSDVVILGIPILQDTAGRYNLNTLHQASATHAHKTPSQWLRRKTTQALIEELGSHNVNLHCDVLASVNGGEAHGTYAHELLAVSYAGWISPAFQLKVNQAFVDSRTAPALPQLHDPTAQALMHLLIDHDATKYRLAAVEQANAALRMQADRTEAKADAAVNNQNFWTIAEYVQYHGLRRQCPESAYVEASRQLQGYCKQQRLSYRDPNTLPRKIPVGGTAWECEWGFHTSVFEDAFNPWLLRRQSQIHLLPGGA